MNNTAAATHSPSQAPLKYWAFVSYSHRDERFVARLVETLETYRVPRRLVGRQGTHGPVPARAFPIFRDRDELGGAGDLGERITDALAVSRTLIVVCSPASCGSRWVSEEVTAFRRLRGAHVLCVIPPDPAAATAGPTHAPAADLAIHECMPRAVVRPAVEGGEVIEPLVADARPDKDGESRAVLKLLSGMLGVDFDELARRDQARAARRRLVLAAVSLGACLLLVASYVLLADLEVSIPGGEAIRAWIDRRSVSVARPVPALHVVAQAASNQRRRSIDVLLEQFRSGKWDVIQSKGDPLPESWTVAQAGAALLRAPELSGPESMEVLAAVSELFTTRRLREADGLKFGWQTARQPFTQAEPALWVTSALASGLARSTSLDAKRREELHAQLRYAQEVCNVYHPLRDSGGWNVFPRQDEPDLHCVYTSTLALLVLLDCRVAGVGWCGSVEERDRLLSLTAGWIIERFDGTASPPGWREIAAPGIVEPILDGLTLQVYAELLRARLDAGIAVPELVIEAIPRHLERIKDRARDFPIGTARIYRDFRNFDGVAMDQKQNIRVLWQPWAIAACAEWLRLVERGGANRDAAETVRTRRSLAHVVLRVVPESAREESARESYIESELIYGLSSIPAP